MVRIMKLLEGKYALITGGGRGIGRAVALEFAKNGANVAIAALEKDELEQTAKDIKKFNVKALSIPVDLSDIAGVKSVVEAYFNHFNRIDILVNNAAEYLADTFLPASAFKEDAALWEDGPTSATIGVESHDRHFEVNTRAAAILMSAFARKIIARKTQWGRIINISADCAWGCPKEISYRASKYALESYSRSAAAELGPYGITVNVVSPGPVQSGYISPEMEEALITDIPLRRVGRPEDIANTVVFLASEQASWVTGQLIFVHGGHRMALGQ